MARPPSSQAPPPVIEAVGVSKRYGATQALDDVSLSIPAGQTLALAGRNGAGKSTLVALLTGLDVPDTGRVLIDGQPAPDAGQRDQWRQLVACVYQRSTVVPGLSITENLFLGDLPRSPRGRVHWDSAHSRASELLGEWGMDLDVRRETSRLTVEQRQLVEIARALRRGSRLILLDEPTAELERAGVVRLFDRMRSLQATGVSFLYISHYLQEMYEVCDQVAVLRDGRHVVTAPVAELGERALIDAMVGAQPVSVSAEHTARTVGDDVVLTVEDVSVDSWCHDIRIDVREREVVGVAGLVGSGKAQLAEAVVGVRAPGTGRVLVRGKPVGLGSVQKAAAAGIGFVPQDRRAAGFAPNLGVNDNICLPVASRLGRWGFSRRSTRDAFAAPLAAQLDVKASSGNQPVAELSGGNQQKTVLARALAIDPQVLVLVSPASGVDVASKRVLLSAVDRTAADGAAVVVVSDDPDDLRGCDRVLIMFRGRLTRELAPGWSDKQLVAAMEDVDE